ncbi:MAG: HAMP domain-containing protein, partial [Paucibacter sp.]|nr:HAMP domain-containing protein [Roseateles sp.]
ARYSEFSRETLEQIELGGPQSAHEHFLSRTQPALKALLAQAAELASRQHAQMQAAQQALEKALFRTQLIVLVIVCAAFVAGAWLAWAVTRSITGPLFDAVAVTERIAAGDLSSVISVVSLDEAGRLMTALGRMQASLAETVGKVRISSQSVSVASAEIAQGNNDLSDRTELQAGALEKTASSMEELNSTVKQNAENANKANELAVNASQIAVQGGHVVSDVVATMKEINESSRMISEIIGVIDEIAFRTNILALNAAVEAARAGTQGRGFAVVATEVRSLAGRTAESAKEIKSLISASVERVEVGTSLVDRAGTTMVDVVESIRKVTDIMGKISAASNQQAAGVAEVGKAVSDMDQGTQQNAALVEQMAAAATSLSTQAQELVEAVAIFKLASR